VVVDVDGNGQREPEIVEIAALAISGTSPVGPGALRTWLVRPQQPITPIVTRKATGSPPHPVRSPAAAAVCVGRAG
jgi:hypothetical protein